MKNERSKKHRRIQVLRIVVAGRLFFGLFVYLFSHTRYTGEDYIGLTVERFFHFDPLIALTTFIASRAFFISLALAGITVLVTIVLGRVVLRLGLPAGRGPSVLVLRLQEDQVPPPASRREGERRHEVLHTHLRARERRLYARPRGDSRSLQLPLPVVRGGGVPGADACGLGARRGPLRAEVRSRGPAGLAVAPEAVGERDVPPGPVRSSGFSPSPSGSTPRRSGSGAGTSARWARSWAFSPAGTCSRSG